ncbi:MAG: undecaprenyl/decaprenyl-phosphate alpha-N-acetylglucosaminyl 1-phosphate transferase [Clostridia bacterium]|nr:undecaprenyl/decaprenyl-phosphate alpha-N-acetylglucosaminyl 1-phosphate transferase [Clostridia bacterium]
MVILIAALVCSILLAYSFTPIVRVLAFKVGAIDVPKDDRRMHKKPVPRIGGLAIFLGFFITCLFFCEINVKLLTLLGGALLIVILGIIDDIKNINAFVKLFFQLAIAALPVVVGGIRINYIHFNGVNHDLNALAIPVTLLWMATLMNAINLIDGLDGLSCGVSTISSVSIFAVILIQGGKISPEALITLILIGSCVGFLPFNRNPARIFMGDTGSLFLGYTLSLISIDGLFKTHALISVFVPLIIFALPLGDTLFAIIRRVLSGKSPFAPDRGHLHHRFIDMGFTQKETVKILYAICGILGLVAVFMCDKMFDSYSVLKSVMIGIVAIVIFFIYIGILKNPKYRANTGLVDEAAVASKEAEKLAEKHETEKK